jgi:hypothetical protein
VQQATRESPIKGKTEERHEAAPRVRSLHEKDDFRGSQLFSAGFQCDSRKYRYFQTPLKLKLISAVFFLLGRPKTYFRRFLTIVPSKLLGRQRYLNFYYSRAQPAHSHVPDQSRPRSHPSRGHTPLPRAATFHLHEPQTGTTARARPAQ